MLTQRKKIIGFTLVEMIIVLVVLAIITAISFPSYMGYLRKTRRTEATIALLDLSTRMERYYAENNNSYTGASITGNLGLASAITTPGGYYTLSIPVITATSYTLQTTPVDNTSQAIDLLCGSFMLTQAGQKTVNGTDSAETCWGK